MTEKTIKELLEMEFFPTDDQGRQLVPLETGFDGEVATIVSHDMPGEFPIIALGPRGYAVQYDEYGNLRQDTFDGYEYSDGNVEHNTLTPPDMQRIVQFVIVEADGTVDCCFDTRKEAEDHLGFGEQIVELDGYGYVREITDGTEEDVFAADEKPSPYTGLQGAESISNPPPGLGAWVRTSFVR